MNMFRDILIVALISLGLGLGLGDPLSWKWTAALGPQVVSAIMFLDQLKPFSVIVCFVLALALFMTRLRY
jgi:hypothetical protein